MKKMKSIHPIMAANNMKLECGFYFFGQCNYRGGGCLPDNCKNFQKIKAHGKNSNNSNHRRR
jgi:hypothetical protein